MTPQFFQEINAAGAVTPLDIAQKDYANQSKISFFDDLADYMQNGFVAVRPTCFWMAKLCWVVPRAGMAMQPALFVRFAVGDLRELLTMIPCPVDWVVFCRKGKERIHVWSLKRLVELAYRRKQK